MAVSRTVLLVITTCVVLSMGLMLSSCSSGIELDTPTSINGMQYFISSNWTVEEEGDESAVYQTKNGTVINLATYSHALIEISDEDWLKLISKSLSMKRPESWSYEEIGSRSFGSADATVYRISYEDIDGDGSIVQRYGKIAFVSGDFYSGAIMCTSKNEEIPEFDAIMESGGIA